MLDVIVNVLNGIRREAYLDKSIPAAGDKRQAGLTGRRAALKDASVARAHAEAKGIGRYVGPGLVDHRYDAHGYRDAFNAHAGVESATPAHAAEKDRS